MKTAILKAGGGFVLEERPLPVPGPGEVRIKVLACGVCSSDLGAWRGGLGEDTVMGHEVVGTVDALGPGVQGPRPGRRVTGCIMQGYAEYTLARAEWLLPVPDALSDAEAVVEPYVCLLSGIRRVGVRPGERVAVISAGYMGLGLARLLKLEGARHVTVLDIKPELLENARAMGADAVMLSGEAEAAGESFDVVYEAAGSQSALDLAGKLVKQYGTIGIVGYHPCVRQIDMQLWAGKAPAVVNIFEYRKENQLAYMREALDLAAAGKLPTGRLMTHRFPLSRLTEAFEVHAAKTGGYIKGCIDDFQS